MVGLSDWISDFRNRLASDPDFRRRAQKIPIFQYFVNRQAENLFSLLNGFIGSQVVLACLEGGLLGLLGARLAEPGEGDYVWVEKYQTFESSHYGHHLAPRVGPALSPTLKAADSIEAALSFDDGGLRVRMSVDLED